MIHPLGASEAFVNELQVGEVRGCSPCSGRVHLLSENKNEILSLLSP